MPANWHTGWFANVEVNDSIRCTTDIGKLYSGLSHYATVGRNHHNTIAQPSSNPLTVSLEQLINHVQKKPSRGFVAQQFGRHALVALHGSHDDLYCRLGQVTSDNIMAACLMCNQPRHKRKKAPDPSRYKALVTQRLHKGKWHVAPIFTQLLVSRPDEESRQNRV